LILLFNIVFCIFLTLMSASEDYLDRYKWKKRLLLIFSPSSSSSLMQKQMKISEKNIDGFLERDLVIIRVFPHQAELEEDEILGEVVADQIRDRFNIVASDKTAILIGKDGTEKLRSRESISESELFSVIDAMPMRQRETKKQR